MEEIVLSGLVHESVCQPKGYSWLAAQPSAAKSPAPAVMLPAYQPLVIRSVDRRSDQKEYEKNQEKRAATGIVTPAGAVRVQRERTEQHENQQNQQNRSNHFVPPVIAKCPSYR
jgi:hypothetical protein